MALNAKQRRFFEEYLLDRNATKAAERAGYPEASAYSQGSRLLKHVEIAKLLEKADALERDKAARRAARAGMTKERWLAELRKLALSNIDDHVTIEEIRFKNTGGKTRSVQTTRAVLTKDRPRARGREIKSIRETKHGVEVTLHSKSSALETLGKHYGWLKNEVELNLPDSGVKVEVTLPSNGREAKEPEGKDS